MERSGPIAIALAVIADTLLAIGWLINPGPALIAALMGGAAVAALLLYMGAWLTLLHGDADARLIGLGAFALALHVAVGGFVGLAPGHVASGIAYLVAAACAAAIWLPAWKSIDREDSDE